MPIGWQTDQYGNQVWMPINPTAEPPTAWSGYELGEAETLLGPENWAEYGGYFDEYDPTSEFYQKEKLQRVGAGIDIGQLTDAWDLKAGQLAGAWGTAETGAWGEFERQKLGAGTAWGLQRGELVRGAGEAQTLWGLQEADITRREQEASSLWGMQKGELKRGWEYKSGALGRTTQSGLRQAISAQETAAGKVGFARAGDREFQRMQREIREGYGREITEGERVLAQNLGIGEEQLSQTLAGLEGQATLGEEGLKQTLAGIGFTLDEAGNLVETGVGKLGVGEEALIQEQARIQNLIDTGQMSYDAAIKSGEFQVGAGITDIGQTLQTNIWESRQAWREAQRGTLHMLLGMDIDLPPVEPPDSTIDTGGGGTGGFPYNPYIEEYLYTDEFGRDDEFDWFGDDWYGWGEDWEYEDWGDEGDRS